MNTDADALLSSCASTMACCGHLIAQRTASTTDQRPVAGPFEHASVVHGDGGGWTLRKARAAL
jgi:hypothetical protein